MLENFLNLRFLYTHKIVLFTKDKKYTYKSLYVESLHKEWGVVGVGE